MGVTATLTGRPTCVDRARHAAPMRRVMAVSDPRGRACRAFHGPARDYSYAGVRPYRARRPYDQRRCDLSGRTHDEPRYTWARGERVPSASAQVKTKPRTPLYQMLRSVSLPAPSATVSRYGFL